ncbi:MAG: hypothetical protein ACOYK8_10575, partial [Alphaproteobacteria bacterium]
GAPVNPAVKPDQAGAPVNSAVKPDQAGAPVNPAVKPDQAGAPVNPAVKPVNPAVEPTDPNTHPNPNPKPDPKPDPNPQVVIREVKEPYTEAKPANQTSSDSFTSTSKTVSRREVPFSDIRSFTFSTEATHLLGMPTPIVPQTTEHAIDKNDRLDPFRYRRSNSIAVSGLATVISSDGGGKPAGKITFAAALPLNDKPTETEHTAIFNAFLDPTAVANPALGQVVAGVIGGYQISSASVNSVIDKDGTETQTPADIVYGARFYAGIGIVPKASITTTNQFKVDGRNITTTTQLNAVTSTTMFNLSGFQQTRGVETRVYRDTMRPDTPTVSELVSTTRIAESTAFVPTGRQIISSNQTTVPVGPASVEKSSVIDSTQFVGSSTQSTSGIGAQIGAEGFFGNKHLSLNKDPRTGEPTNNVVFEAVAGVKASVILGGGTIRTDVYASVEADIFLNRDFCNGSSFSIQPKLGFNDGAFSGQVSVVWNGLDNNRHCSDDKPKATVKEEFNQAAQPAAIQATAPVATQEAALPDANTKLTGAATIGKLDQATSTLFSTKRALKL